VAKTPWPERVTADDEAETFAAARKLFAGECEFIWGTGDIDSLPPQSLNEVAFVGRSNAGKSSLINALTGRKTLARVSHTPGRTREINFFKLGGKLMLVDLPGYGYAKASKTLAAEWQRLILAYLRGRANLRRVVLLLDARRGVLEIDRAVMELLDKSAVSYCLALTKIDQLSKAERATVLSDIETESKRHTAAHPEVFATSALKTLGLDALKVQLAALAVT
jgi:GTP-binding protein